MIASDERDRGGKTVPLTREFLQHLERLRGSLSREQFAQKYLVAKSTWHKWINSNGELRAESNVVAAICRRILQNDSLRPEQVGLPSETCEVLQKLASTDGKKLPTDRVRMALVFIENDKMTRAEFKRLALDMVAKAAGNIVDFEFGDGSIVLTLDLTRQQADAILLAVQEGWFDELGLISFRVPEEMIGDTAPQVSGATSVERQASEPSTEIAQQEKRRRRKPGAAASLPTKDYRDFLMAVAIAQFPRLYRDLSSEDVVDETLLEFTKHKEQFSGSTDGQIKAWMRKAFSHIFYHRLRENKFSARKSIETMPPIVADDNPVEQAERNELIERIQEAVTALPEQLREVMVLHYYDDMTTEAIASRLKIARATVYRRLSQAQKILRDQLPKPSDEK